MAGTVANSGLEAKAVRFSTASMSGAVATPHLFLFSSEKSPSRALRSERGGEGHRQRDRRETVDSKRERERRSVSEQGYPAGLEGDNTGSLS